MTRNPIANRRLMLIIGTCLASAASQAFAQEAASVAPPSSDNDIIVTGSRIPRAVAEGPAPVTVISSDDIRANGYGSVPDLLRAVTQNGGETQSQQSFSGSSFTPGAQHAASVAGDDGAGYGDAGSTGNGKRSALSPLRLRQPIQRNAGTSFRRLAADGRW